MVVFFLPNGLGDVLMAIPCLRHLTANLGRRNTLVIVANHQQRELVHEYVDELVEVWVRYDSKPLSQLRLWLRLLLARPTIILAPMVSNKKKNIVFFGLLGVDTLFPADAIKSRFFRVSPTSLSLQCYDGHQVEYYFQFCAAHCGFVEHRISPSSSVVFTQPSNAPVSAPKGYFAVVVGMSCGAAERHKLPDVVFFVALLSAINRRVPIKVTFIGSGCDLAAMNVAQKSLAGQVECSVALDVSLPELITRLSSFDLGIAGTTGQGHLMAAAGLPMLVLAGVTDPHQSGPFVSRAAILTHQYRCGPCYQQDFRFGCGKVQCMDTLDAEEGGTLAYRLLSEPGFGLRWRSTARRTVKSPSEIRLLHSKPMSYWLNNGGGSSCSP